MLKKKPDIKKWKKAVDNIAKKQLPLLANGIITDIVDRTQKGKDKNMKDFKVYTSEYKTWKSKKYGTKVNLTVGGHMLNNISWKPLKKGIRFYFTSNEQRAKALGNNKKRKFFGLDKKQKKEIAKDLRKKVRF